MARRLWTLCRAVQWNILKNSSMSHVSLLSQKIRTTDIRLVEPVSRLSAFACSRSQHFQSADSEFNDDGEQPKLRDTHTREYEAILIPVVLEGEPLTTEKWSQVKTEVLNLKRQVNEDNIDAIIMGICIQHKQFAVGSSLLSSIRETNALPNVATLGRFLKLCYTCEAGDEETLLQVCDEIRRRCPVMDATTADNVIHGLARTSRWQECFELLSEIKLSAVPSSSTYNVLAEACFKYGELKKGWEIMEQMMLIDRRPTPNVYKAWIDQCLKTKGTEANVMIGQLLDFWAEHDLRPSLDVAEYLRYWFESDGYQWEGCFTALTPRGSCQNCRTVLRKRKVTEQEFHAMRSQFFEQVVVGNNVFLKTNPEELETFQQFLSRTAPYDVVIDGLNVAFSTGRQGPLKAVKTLESVVRHFAGKNCKMLILGRRHMQNWPRKEMNYIHEYASVFLAQNLSQDDPFLLYAAMYSGPETLFVSRDLMRSHVYLLKNSALRRIFRRWQQQRQMQVFRNSSGQISVMPPLSFNPSVQQGPGSVWHIPYDMEYRIHPKQNIEPPRHWLCLRKVDVNSQHNSDDP